MSRLSRYGQDRGEIKGAFAEVSVIPAWGPGAGPQDKILRTVAPRGAERCRGFIQDRDTDTVLGLCEVMAEVMTSFF